MGKLRLLLLQIENMANYILKKIQLSVYNLTVLYIVMYFQPSIIKYLSRLN